MAKKKDNTLFGGIKPAPAVKVVTPPAPIMTVVTEEKPAERKPKIHWKDKKIHQSTMKMLDDYEAGFECGGIVEAKLNGSFPDTASWEMELGHFFEYITFGTLPRSGKIPQPQYKEAFMKKVAKGEIELKPTNRDEILKKIEENKMDTSDMYIDYARAIERAIQTRIFLHKMGLKIIGVNVKISNELGEGICDVIVEGNLVGGQAILDTKYSGMLYERTQKMGFGALTTEEDTFYAGLQKRYHGKQAKHYSWIKQIPFYFFVVSSTEKEGYRFLKCNISDGAMALHEQAVVETKSKLELYSVTGFTPRPQVMKCRACPLFNICNDRAYYPLPEPVTLD